MAGFCLHWRTSERKERAMKNRTTGLLAATLGFAVLLGACSAAQKEATEAAISAAQTAINAAQGAAEKYVPEQTKAAQDSLQAAKDALAKGNYEEALNDAKNAADKAKGALDAAKAKKEEWTNTWNNLNRSAPKTMNEVQAKLDAYKKNGKLPAGVDQATMDIARAQYDQLKQNWADATAAYKNGNLVDAMQKASVFKDGLQKLKDLLGIQS
jgi:DNA repair exonuclease SbcCD ATPase subunit